MTRVDGFAPMPERMYGELEERQAFSKHALAYNMTFLDDVLRALLPHDLVALTAGTGIGKTELALHIAAGNALRGRPTHYFALEAEPRELERRRKYSLLAQEAWRTKSPGCFELNYTDWFLGRCEGIVGHLNAWADAAIAEQLRCLFTYYRGQKFDGADLGRAILKVHQDTTLIVVDHLHYVDAGEDEDENRALADTVKIIREVSLNIGKPVLLVVHVRKRDQRSRHLMPQTDDIHGSSNVVKIATQLIALERATDIEPTKWYLAPTYVSVEKDRRAGKQPFVALCSYNKLTREYAPEYTLGRVKGMKWEALGPGDAPGWAKNHRALASDSVPSTQSEIPHASTRYA